MSNDTVNCGDGRRPPIDYGIIALTLSVLTLIGGLIIVTIIALRCCEKMNIAKMMRSKRRRHPAGHVAKRPRAERYDSNWYAKWLKQRDATTTDDELIPRTATEGACGRFSVDANRLEHKIDLQPMYIDGRAGSDTELWEWRHRQLHNQRQHQRSIQIPLFTDALANRSNQLEMPDDSSVTYVSDRSSALSEHVYEEIGDGAVEQAAQHLQSMETTDGDEERAISAPGKMMTDSGRKGVSWHDQLYGRSDSAPTTDDEVQIHGTIIRVEARVRGYKKSESGKEEDLLERKRLERKGVRPWRPADDRQLKVTLV